MEAEKRGSVILMILIVITVITILASSALKINGLMGQLISQREKYYQKREILEALALYGIGLGYTHFGTQNSAKEPVSKQFASWPPGYSQYQGMVTVSPQKKQWIVVAQLGQNNRYIDTITALATPTAQGWQIARWEYSPN